MNWKPFMQWLLGMWMIVSAGYLLTESIPGDPLERLGFSEISGNQSVNASVLASRQRMKEAMGLHLPAWPLQIEVRALAQWPDIESKALYAASADPQSAEKCKRIMNFYASDANHPALKMAVKQGDVLAFNAFCRLAAAPQWQLISSGRGIHWWLPSVQWHGENRFFLYLWGNKRGAKGLFQGHLGQSYASGQPVSLMLSQRWPRTVALGILALLLGLVGGLPLAVWFERRRFQKKSAWIEYVALAITAIPGFVGGTALLLLFANPDVLDWFPVGGWEPAGGFSSDITWIQCLKASASYWVLPLISISYGLTVGIALQLHGLLAEETRAMYFLTASAKGLSRKQAVWRHALPNLYPVIVTLLTQSLPWMLGGSVVMETLFSWPGLGKLTMDAIWNKDQPVLIGMIGLTGVVSLTAFMLSRYLQAWLDPRTRNA